MLTRTDKPLPVIIFTLTANSAEHYRVHCKVLYLQKRTIELVANGAVVEVVALQLMGCSFDP